MKTIAEHLILFAQEIEIHSRNHSNYGMRDAFKQYSKVLFNKGLEMI